MHIHMCTYISAYIYAQNILYNVIDKTVQILKQPINWVSLNAYRMLTEDIQSAFIPYIHNMYIYLSYVITLTLCTINLIPIYNTLICIIYERRGKSQVTS